MSRCTCEFPGRCDGSGWLNCRGRAWGNCFCQCGCTEDCYGCDECLSREYDDDLDIIDCDHYGHEFNESNRCVACGIPAPSNVGRAE